MRTLAAGQPTPILDLQSYLSQSAVEHSGAVWWDFVHLTSYGQAVVAQWLAPRLLPYLQRGARPNTS